MHPAVDRAASRLPGSSDGQTDVSRRNEIGRQPAIDFVLAGALIINAALEAFFPLLHRCHSRTVFAIGRRPALNSTFGCQARVTGLASNNASLPLLGVEAISRLGFNGIAYLGLQLKGGVQPSEFLPLFSRTEEEAFYGRASAAIRG